MVEGRGRGERGGDEKDPENVKPPLGADEGDVTKTDVASTGRWVRLTPQATLPIEQENTKTDLWVGRTERHKRQPEQA